MARTPTQTTAPAELMPADQQAEQQLVTLQDNAIVQHEAELNQLALRLNYQGSTHPDVLENSAREPALQTLPAYGVLLYRAAMKLPRHREDDVFVLYDRLQRLLTAADGTPACPAAPECSRAGEGEMPARGFLRRGTAPAAPAGEADTACEPLPVAGSAGKVTVVQLALIVTL